MLHLIVAILSLLLLAGVFGHGMDSHDDGTTRPGGNTHAGQDTDDADDVS